MEKHTTEPEKVAQCTSARARARARVRACVRACVNRSIDEGKMARVSKDMSDNPVPANLTKPVSFHRHRHIAVNTACALAEHSCSWSKHHRDLSPASIAIDPCGVRL